MNCFACVPLVKEEGLASFPYQPVGTNALRLEAVHFGSRSSLLAFTLSILRIILTTPHISCICTNSNVGGRWSRGRRNVPRVGQSTWLLQASRPPPLRLSATTAAAVRPRTAGGVWIGEWLQAGTPWTRHTVELWRVRGCSRLVERRHMSGRVGREPGWIFDGKGCKCGLYVRVSRGYCTRLGVTTAQSGVAVNSQGTDLH
eukprot:COSAG06_NODE_542_length_14469_cov_39.223591_6_plen_201_part_00